MRRDVFQAIADPTRREMIQILSAKPLQVNAVADFFEISRPAVSKHLRILCECGLVEITQYGRERYCRANMKPLKEVADWAGQYRNFWNKKLDALEAFLALEEKPVTKKKKITATKKRKS